MSDTVADYEKQARVDLSEAYDLFEAAIRHVDARVVFTSYALSRLTDGSADDTAKHARPAPVAVELAAWMLYPHFNNSTCDDTDLVNAAISALEKYQTAYSFAEIFSQTESCAPLERGSLQLHLRLHAGMVRGSAYISQVVRRVENAFASYEVEMAGFVGVGPIRAKNIAKALLEQVEENVRQFGRRISNHIKSCKAEMAENPDAENQKETQKNFQVMWAQLQRSWIPSYDQVSQKLGKIARNEWESLASIIGLVSVKTPDKQDVIDIQDRPIFFMDRDHAFAVHGVSVFDAIFNFYDDFARTEEVFRERYAQTVSRWMEEKIAEFFERLFPSDCILRNACYCDPKRPGGEAEADIVVLWGPFLIVAEAKARRIHKEALRGGAQKLKAALSKNIQDAFFQANRVVEALHKFGSLLLKEKNTGRVVEVSRTSIHRVMPISVTLQYLAGIPTQLAVTQRLGLFKGGAFPWSVCVDDLDVITQFSRSPDIFLHYIERRIAHQNLDIELSGDELDIFGHYLDTRLHPSIYENRREFGEDGIPNHLSFLGGEERFEPFYTAEWLRKNPSVNEIGLDAPDEVHEILRELRARSDDGARWIAFAILGLSSKMLKRLAAAFRELRVKSPESGKILRISDSENSIVFNVMAADNQSDEELFQQITIRTRIEHYRRKACASVSFGIRRSSERVFEFAQWLECDWEHDDTLEGFLAEERQRSRLAFLPSQASKPGRNSACPCGSGVKFKKCCWGKFDFK